ncbi:MAG: 50S ribosomal protein L22 [Solirubrobacterales bacterium]
MADEKKTTKKADAAKATGEKAEAKKAGKKDSKARAKAEKKPKTAAAKKESKQASGKDAKAKKADAKGKAKKAGGKTAAKTGAKAKKEPAKKAARAPAAPPVVKASARYVRIAPRKARLIADQVRGMHIESARALLQFSPRGAAHPIHKLINSAAANAENNHDLIGDEMRVASITVDEGPTLRRFRPRAMGRATPINKRTSHIRVALTPAED